MAATDRFDDKYDVIVNYCGNGYENSLTYQITVARR